MKMNYNNNEEDKNSDEDELNKKSDSLFKKYSSSDIINVNLYAVKTR